MGLEVHNLRCARGGRRILDGIGFSLRSGQALLLRGPNGAGKSTLLRALAGFVPSEGEFRLDGVSMDDRDTWEEQIAYTGHLDAIKPQLSVGENLQFWAALCGGNATAALDRMGLGAIADRPAGLCSAGQKRRLGLARLLLSQRRLWLLDEPTVSLDAQGTATLAAAVEAHLDGNGMAIIATHIDLGLEADTLRIEPAATQAPAGPFGVDGFV